MTMVQKFLDTIPSSAALFDYRQGLRFRHQELLGLVEGKSKELRSLGLQNNDRVVLGISDPIESLVTLFSCWNLGVCAIVVNPNLAQPEQERVFVAINAKIWLGKTHLSNEIKQQDVASDIGDADLVLMTSGTTGNPKGVALSIESLQNRLANNIKYIGRENLQNTLCVLPLFFGHGLIGNCLTGLAAGGEVTLWQTPNIRELLHLPNIIEQREIEFMSSVPSFWKVALPLTERPKTNLKRVHIGSAPLSITLWQDIATWAGTNEAYNTFGMSETANWISGGVLKYANNQDGFVGKPWGGEFAVFVDGKREQFGKGEVLVKNDSMMTGYLDQPEKTQDAMMDGWLHTGDIGEIDGNGSLTLVGRIKSEINVGGIKVLSEEVELMLERHDQITEACAFPVPDAFAGERVGVAIVVNKDLQLKSEDVVLWCGTQARKEAVPLKVFILGEIPKNDRGKIVRTDVARRCLDADS